MFEFIADNWVLWTVLVLAIAPAWVFKKKLGIEVQGPLCLWRTKKGLRFLDKHSKSRAWDALADLGLIFSFGILGAAFLLFSNKKKDLRFFGWILAAYAVFIAAALVAAIPAVFSKNLEISLDVLIVLFLGGFGLFITYGLVIFTASIIGQYFSGSVPMPGIQPIIPGVEIPGAPLFIPIHAIVGLVVLIIVHEFAHGIVARRQGLRVKSLGLLTAGIFPIGAFAEPDEQQLKKTSPRKRMRVYAAGSMSNFAFGGIILFLVLIPFQYAMLPLVQDQVSNNAFFLVEKVEPGSSAAQAGIANGTKIFNPAVHNALLPPMLAVSLPQTRDNIATVQTENGTVSFAANQTSYGGITRASFKWERDPGLAYAAATNTRQVLFWMSVLNFIVGIVNFMPFAIFDGSRLFEDLLAFFTKRKKTARKITLAMTILILVMLLVNVLPYFIKKF